MSYAGPPKATAFLNELGASNGVYDGARSDELLDLLTMRDGLERIAQSLPWTAIDTAKRASSEHLTALRSVIVAESEDRVDG